MKQPYWNQDQHRTQQTNAKASIETMANLFVQGIEEADSLDGFTQTHLISQNGVSAPAPGVPVVVWWVFIIFIYA